MLMKGVFKSENSGEANEKLAGVRFSDGNECNFTSCIVAFPEVEHKEDLGPVENKKGRIRSKSLDAAQRKAYCPALPLDTNENLKSKKVCKELSSGENVPLIIASNAFPLTGIPTAGLEHIKGKKEAPGVDTTVSDIKPSTNPTLLVKKGNVWERKCNENTTSPKKKDTVSNKLNSDAGEWLISFSTCDSNVFKTIPTDIFQPYPLDKEEDSTVQKSFSPLCDREKSFLTLPNSIPHVGKSYGYLRPLSADFKTKYPCLWNTHKTTELHHTDPYSSTPDLPTCGSQCTDSFPSLGFEAVGVYSVKRPAEQLPAIENKLDSQEAPEGVQNTSSITRKSVEDIYEWKEKESFSRPPSPRDHPDVPESAFLTQQAKKNVESDQCKYYAAQLKNEKELNPQVNVMTSNTRDKLNTSSGNSFRYTPLETIKSCSKTNSLSDLTNELLTACEHPSQSKLQTTYYVDRKMDAQTNGSNESLIMDEYLNEHTRLFNEKKLNVRKHSSSLISPEAMFNNMNSWHDIPSLTNPPAEHNSEIRKVDYNSISSSDEPDIHQIKKYIPNKLLQNGVNPSSVVGYHNIVLRTSHINDHLSDSSISNANYSGELINGLTHGIMTNSSENQYHSKAYPEADYLPCIQSGSGSCSYGNTESSSMLNTSRVSVDSVSISSSVSDSDPLTPHPFQAVCAEQNLEKLEEQTEQQWRDTHASDLDDSDVDGHSDVCESLESLVDHGLDSDAPDSSAESDISDDESIDVHDDLKSFEDKDIGDGASLSSPEVSTTVPDDFTTISLTKDYYPIKEDPPIGTVGKTYPWLRFSLFPNMPPTINFRVMDTPPLNIPPEVKRILKWKSTAVTPAIVRRVLYNSGMRIVKRSRQWVGVWSKHMRANLFKTIKDFQKFNHFPGTFQIGRKDTLWRNHVRLRNIHGKKNYDFLPVTFIIPSDMKQLRHAWEKSSPHQMWIIKPPASARGTGIKIIHKFMQIPKIRPLIVQKYLSSPFLINGVKFDLRIYVYITSFYPLRIYIYKEGLARFASVMYSSCPRTVSDRYMHLTNYSVNRKSITYTANEDVNACKGHKWSLKALWGYLTEKGYDTTAIWNSIVDIVIKTIISCETTVSTLTRLNLKNGNSCHELFGFDIILDSNLKPWLLEVNISPSLQSTSKLDASIKGQMCRDLLNLSGVTIPPHLEKMYQTAFLEKVSVDAGYNIENLCFDKRLYRMNLSIEERAKQVAFSRMDRQEYLPIILQNLLPDDIRQLVIAEDERSRSGQYIRVFPSTTSHRYHKFFDRARYYNHLFDAWETQYSNCRQEGIQRLSVACQNGLHLKTVPKDSSKVSSPKTEIGRISSSSSLRIRCCSRSATNRAIQRACRSARNLFARMKIQRHRPPNTSDLEDLSKSSNAGSGDHLLKSKIHRDTEDYYHPINSPQNSVSLNENNRRLSKPQQLTVSSPTENQDCLSKNDDNYYLNKSETSYTNNYLNSDSNSTEDKAKYSNTSTMANGMVVTHHCRGCALLSQGYYLSNNMNFKKDYQLIETDNPSPSTLVERVPIHNSQIKGHSSSNNRLIKDSSAVTAHSNFTSN